MALLIDVALTHCVLGTGKSFSFVEKNRVLRKESYYKDCSPGGPPPAGDWIKKKLHNFIQLLPSLPAFTKYFWEYYSTQLFLLGPVVNSKLQNITRLWPQGLHIIILINLLYLANKVLNNNTAAIPV